MTRTCVIPISGGSGQQYHGGERPSIQEKILRRVGGQCGPPDRDESDPDQRRSQGGQERRRVTEVDGETYDATYEETGHVDDEGRREYVKLIRCTVRPSSPDVIDARL